MDRRRFSNAWTILLKTNTHYLVLDANWRIQNLTQACIVRVKIRRMGSDLCIISNWLPERQYSKGQRYTVCPKHLEVQHRQMCWLSSLAISPLDAFSASLYWNLEETISLIICWLSEMQLSLFIKEHYQVCHTSYKMNYKM